MKFFFSSSHFQVKSINPFNACTNKLSISLHHLKSLFFFFKSISIFQKINLINSFPFNYIIPPQDGRVITERGSFIQKEGWKTLEREAQMYREILLHRRSKIGFCDPTTLSHPERRMFRRGQSQRSEESSSAPVVFISLFFGYASRRALASTVSR